MSEGPITALDSTPDSLGAQDTQPGEQSRL
jgi:hypothetical protein